MFGFDTMFFKALSFAKFTCRTNIDFWFKNLMMARRNDPLDCKVYVGGLPQDATSQEVFDILHLCTRIMILRLKSLFGISWCDETSFSFSTKCFIWDLGWVWIFFLINYWELFKQQFLKIILGESNCVCMYLVSHPFAFIFLFPIYVAGRCF